MAVGSDAYGAFRRASAPCSPNTGLQAAAAMGIDPRETGAFARAVFPERIAGARSIGGIGEQEIRISGRAGNVLEFQRRSRFSYRFHIISFPLVN